MERIDNLLCYICNYLFLSGYVDYSTDMAVIVMEFLIQVLILAEEVELYC